MANTVNPEPKKASDEQIALLREAATSYVDSMSNALTTVLDQLERQNAELEQYRKGAAPRKPLYRFSGVGELERTGYIPEGSAAEREQAAKQPVTSEQPKSLAQQVADAQATVASWTPEKRANAVLEGTDPYLKREQPEKACVRYRYSGLLRPQWLTSCNTIEYARPVFGGQCKICGGRIVEKEGE